MAVVAPAIAAGASGRRYAPLDDDDAVVARPSPFTPQRLAIAGALVLAAIVGYVVFNRPTQIFGPPVPVAVAAVTGRTVEDATNLLQAQGLEVKVVAVASDLVPKNRVVKQNPAAKTKVPPKSVVELDVSTGLPLVSLMDLRQYSKDDAERYLRNNKLLVKEVVRYDDKVRRGDVISQSPGPAAQVAIHSAVTLVISNGVRPVGVPDLVSHKLSDASKSLARLNLKLAVTERVPSDSIPADVIASQQPSPGTPVDPGTTISVTVSSGAPKMVLPDLNGRNVSDAMAALSAAGLVSRVNYIVDSSVLPGTVMQQDPAASAPTHKNATITLSVAVPGTVPDVGGTTLDQARTTLQNAGYKPGGVIFEPQGEAGRVIRTDPAAGAQLRPGETVNLHVSGQQ
ncbi:MAG: PASTA domain-containing protein [Candidatus Eremiobacteraeota bacterium]|nr:PASTA domain-containing protein [Candidatus Eremiobacteraeota bacterium]